MENIPSQQELAEWNDRLKSQLLTQSLSMVRPQFEAETWRAFELIWVHHHKATEVAQALDRPIGWVYVAKSQSPSSSVRNSSKANRQRLSQS